MGQGPEMGSFHQRGLLEAGVGECQHFLIPTSCTEGAESLPIPEDGMLVSGSCQGVIEGCCQCPLCRRQQGRAEHGFLLALPPSSPQAQPSR